MKNKKRCNVKGCTGFKFTGDRRCLKHIRIKYISVWSRSFGDYGNAGRKERYSLDSVDFNDTSR